MNNNAQLKVSKFDEQSGHYILARTQQMPVDLAKELENYLVNSIMIMQFYFYEITYPDGTYVAKYTSYADALGIVKANNLTVNKNVVTAVA